MGTIIAIGSTAKIALLGLAIACSIDVSGKIIYRQNVSPFRFFIVGFRWLR